MTVDTSEGTLGVVLADIDQMQLSLAFSSWMYNGCLDGRFGAMEWCWPRLICCSFAKHHLVCMNVGLHRATGNCHLHCSLSLLCQGIIQDGKIIFMPNGFITQCPNLNRSKWRLGISEFNITWLVPSVRQKHLEGYAPLCKTDFGEDGNSARTICCSCHCVFQAWKRILRYLKNCSVRVRKD